jgi:hypothetical protein
MNVMKYSYFCAVCRNKAANMSKERNEGHLYTDIQNNNFAGFRCQAQNLTNKLTIKCCAAGSFSMILLLREHKQGLGLKT